MKITISLLEELTPGLFEAPRIASRALRVPRRNVRAIQCSGVLKPLLEHTAEFSVQQLSEFGVTSWSLQPANSPDCFLDGLAKLAAG